jgi:hypothetical protein
MGLANAKGRKMLAFILKMKKTFYQLPLSSNGVGLKAKSHFAKKMENKVFIFFKLPSSLVPTSIQMDLFVLLLHVGSCHNHGVVKLAASV